MKLKWPKKKAEWRWGHKNIFNLFFASCIFFFLLPFFRNLHGYVFPLNPSWPLRPDTYFVRPSSFFCLLSNLPIKLPFSFQYGWYFVLRTRKYPYYCLPPPPFSFTWRLYRIRLRYRHIWFSSASFLSHHGISLEPWSGRDDFRCFQRVSISFLLDRTSTRTSKSDVYFYSMSDNQLELPAPFFLSMFFGRIHTNSPSPPTDRPTKNGFNIN